MPKRISGWEIEQAVRRNDKEFILTQFREHNLDFSVSFRGRRALTSCVVENRPEALRLFLQLGADPDEKSYEGGRREPPLITAVRLKNLSCVRLLTSRGANPTVTNFYGQDAVYQAVVENVPEILDHLLELLPAQVYKHETGSACPIHLALHNSVNQPWKKNCLALLLRHYYTCSCLPALMREVEGNWTRGEGGLTQEQQHPPQPNIRSDLHCRITLQVHPDTLNWLHQAYGFSPLVLSPLLNVHESEDSSQIKTRLEVIERKECWEVGKEGAAPTSSPSSSPPTLLLKLGELTRIAVRAHCAVIAWQRKISFHRAVTSLPLPWKLINFLFLPQLFPQGRQGHYTLN